MRIGVSTAECPPEILAALRAIDPKAELVHLGGTSWLLGVRGPNPAAVKQLARVMTIPRPMPPGLTDSERATLDLEIACQMQVAQLCADGFKPVQMYTMARPTHEVVQDFALRDHNWRVRPKEAFQEMKDAASLDLGNKRRVQRFRESVQAESKSMFKYLMQKAKNFLMPGRAIGDAVPSVTTPAPAPSPSTTATP